MDYLERVRLVDAYSGSIWGLRIRRSDVERAAVLMSPGVGVLGEELIISRIRKLVTCERVTERIFGGDRVEGQSHLV